MNSPNLKAAIKAWREAQRNLTIALEVVTRLRLLDDTTSEHVARLLAEERGIKAGVHLLKSGNYCRGRWKVERITLGYWDGTKDPDFGSLSLHCRKVLKSGQVGIQKATFSSYELTRKDQPIEIVKQKGGDDDGNTQEGSESKAG